MLTVAEVAKHNSKESCWVIVADYVYDVTEFLDHHPGGAAQILRFAGLVRSRPFTASMETEPRSFRLLTVI